MIRHCKSINLRSTWHNMNYPHLPVTTPLPDFLSGFSNADNRRCKPDTVTEEQKPSDKKALHVSPTAVIVAALSTRCSLDMQNNSTVRFTFKLYIKFSYSSGIAVIMVVGIQVVLTRRSGLCASSNHLENSEIVQ